ncbi:hypothetical protein L0F63_000600 [Massospora cicadina]|nr:hypothetical protein L0F63_000600 [Massospora cicadina]
MDIRCHEPASCANRVAPMEYRYLSCFQAQRFMKNFGLAITERALQRLDLYATLLVSDLLMDIPITASPTLPRLKSAIESPELLAHIEVTNGALTHEVAKFLGEFFSQLLQAMLKELAKVALISNLTSITLALVEEAFHPRNAYMLLKFPMLNAAETVLVQHAATPGLTQQGLILVNKFLDEVILSLSRKLIMKRLTLSQLMVALNLSLKSCPLVEESIECVNRKFPSLIAVPVRPLVSSSCDDCPLPDAALIRHHYRLLAHYYSPHSELYQSRAISDFFRTQPFVLNTEAARYLAAVTAQLGLSVIQACADSLLVQQSNLEIATNVMGTHLLVPKLAELLPNCAITHRLNLYNFPHVDPTPDQLAAIILHRL